MAVPQSQVVNITGYRFLDLPDRDELKEVLQDKCDSLGLRGLILVAHEGINYFCAGSQQTTDQFRAFLDLPDAGPLGSPLRGRFQDIPCKVSYSTKMPFKRMLVKAKKEIISLGMDEVRPVERTGNRLDAEELKRWLDEGRPCVLVDTRSDYETRIGTFEAAVDLKIDHFREWPAAIQTLPAEAKGMPVVTFCTGGVRCEKATTVLMDAGFSDVYQLDGGILRYFEKCGGAHWRGDCFVFDDRVAVTPELAEADVTMCFKCREPLTKEDRASPLYVYEQQCPYCASRKTRRYHMVREHHKPKEPKAPKPSRGHPGAETPSPPGFAGAPCASDGGLCASDPKGDLCGESPMHEAPTEQPQQVASSR